MRNMLLAAVLAATAATGCSKAATTDSPPKPTAPAPIATTSIDEVDAAIASGQAQAVDCNGQSTRKRMGVVPGAILLSDEETYAMSELPSDKSKALVFYCANQQCGASHQAAERALTAGYTHVKVMPDGIAGWTTAGKKTQQL